MEHPEGHPQQVIRTWLRDVLATTGWSPHRLAREARISPATISRALNEDQFKTSVTTIDKISVASNIPAPWESGIVLNSRSDLKEPEAEFIVDVTALMPDALAHREDEAVFRLNSRAIELAGYLPGDLLLVSQRVTPRQRDIICLQVVNYEGAAPETTFRIFDPPYAVTKTQHEAAERKPLLIDNERATIWGTVIRMMRVRG